MVKRMKMPITKRNGKYYWGSKGPFDSRKKAEEVAQAAHASGYEGSVEIEKILPALAALGGAAAGAGGGLPTQVGSGRRCDRRGVADQLAGRGALGPDHAPRNCRCLSGCMPDRAVLGIVQAHMPTMPTCPHGRMPAWPEGLPSAMLAGGRIGQDTRGLQRLLCQNATSPVDHPIDRKAIRHAVHPHPDDRFVDLPDYAL